MDKNFEVDNYSKIGSLMISTYLLLELYHLNWYSYSGIWESIICIGAPLWLYGLYRTLPHLLKYSKKD